MKALIIAEPWIGLILSGAKTWEMRKTPIGTRGLIALIRKGSGKVVGVAQLVDSLPALTTREAYAQAQPRHGIPPERQAQAFDDGWRTPWVLDDARALPQPVPYAHPSGAVIFVNLDERVSAAVLAQVGTASTTPAAPTAVVQPETSPPVAAALASHAPTDAHGAVRLSGGNVRNNHINLRSIAHIFPADAFGGSDRTRSAPRRLTLTFRPGGTVETDIDDTKKIFRARGAVGDFFRLAQAREGDTVAIDRTGPYAYSISLRKTR